MFENLKSAKRAVLWWGSGLDSTLLLAMLREQPIDFDIVQIRSGWTKNQRKRADDLILKWNLKVLSYAPSSVSFIGQDNELSAVFEFAVGGGTIPMLRDVIPGTQCVADIDPLRLHHPPIKWDLQIVGSRKDDTHYAGAVVPSKSWKVGDTTFYAPLYSWDRQSVKAELRKRGIDDTEVDDDMDTGNLSVCHNCIKGEGQVFCPKANEMIDSVKWNRDENLASFRKAFSV